LIIKPALAAGMYWLVIAVIVNAAISAAYYLRIVAAMYLRPEPSAGFEQPAMAIDQLPASVGTLIAVVLSSVGVLFLGIILPATQLLTTHAQDGTQIDDAMTTPVVQTASAGNQLANRP
ncbi:MAG TPA: hypothetical protein VG722_05540, partial [Tepidisphaeraceae bacterium]|nr:hypothetical protein [Tepidisphaeraceae bacterium]